MGIVPLSLGKSDGDVALNPTQPSTEVKGRVELYLYSFLLAFMACSAVNFTL